MKTNKEIIIEWIKTLTDDNDFLLIQDWQNGYTTNENEKMYPKIEKLATKLLFKLQKLDRGNER